MYTEGVRALEKTRKRRHPNRFKTVEFLTTYGNCRSVTICGSVNRKLLQELPQNWRFRM